MIRNSRKGFTLMELIIVIGLIALLAIGLFAGINPFAQINKANDAKRKNDLSILQKTFEDYYNDKSCYPRPSDICVGPNPGNNCVICGKDKNSPANLNPYLHTIPCDPNYPSKHYLYSVPAGETTCPSSYQIYVNLGNTSDQSIKDVGCEGSVCGPYADSNYGSSSPNSDLERHGTVTPTPTISITPPSTPTPPVVTLTPTPPVYCNVDSMFKLAGQSCNIYNCTVGMQQSGCVCTSGDPCYSDYPTCHSQCILPP